jgi:hypothetical protein
VNSTEEEVVLEDMTKAELQDHADSLGVDYSDSDTKAELIEAITTQAEPPDEGEQVDDEGNVIDSESDDEEESAYDSFPGSVPSELEPARRPVDVDIANIEDPEAEYEGEVQAPLNAESWVTLDGSNDQVPDELDGHVAAVVESPVSTEHDPDTGTTKTFLSPEGLYTVKERSQGILLNVTADAFKSVHTHGRPDQFA